MSMKESLDILANYIRNNLISESGTISVTQKQIEGFANVFESTKDAVDDGGYDNGKKSTTGLGSLTDADSGAKEEWSDIDALATKLIKQSSNINPAAADTIERQYILKLEVESLMSMASDCKSLNGVYASAFKEGYEYAKKKDEANKRKESSISSTSSSDASTTSNFDPREYINEVYNADLFKPYLCACIYANADEELSDYGWGQTITLSDTTIENHVVHDIKPLFQSISGMKSPQIEISYDASNTVPLTFSPFKDSKDITLTFIEDNSFSVYYTFKKIQENLVAFATKKFKDDAPIDKTKYAEIVIGFFDYASIDISDTNIKNLYLSNIANNRLRMIANLSLKWSFVKKVDNQNIINPDTTKTDGVSKTIVTLVPWKALFRFMRSDGTVEEFTFN